MISHFYQQSQASLRMHYTSIIYGTRSISNKLSYILQKINRRTSETKIQAFSYSNSLREVFNKPYLIVCYYITSDTYIYFSTFDVKDFRRYGVDRLHVIRRDQESPDRAVGDPRWSEVKVSGEKTASEPTPVDRRSRSEIRAGEASPRGAEKISREFFRLGHRENCKAY